MHRWAGDGLAALITPSSRYSAVSCRCWSARRLPSIRLPWHRSVEQFGPLPGLAGVLVCSAQEHPCRAVRLTRVRWGAMRSFSSLGCRRTPVQLPPVSPAPLDTMSAAAADLLPASDVLVIGAGPVAPVGNLAGSGSGQQVRKSCVSSASHQACDWPGYAKGGLHSVGGTGAAWAPGSSGRPRALIRRTDCPP